MENRTYCLFKIFVLSLPLCFLEQSSYPTWLTCFELEVGGLEYAKLLLDALNAIALIVTTFFLFSTMIIEHISGAFPETLTWVL